MQLWSQWTEQLSKLHKKISYSFINVIILYLIRLRRFVRDQQFPVVGWRKGDHSGEPIRKMLLWQQPILKKNVHIQSDMVLTDFQGTFFQTLDIILANLLFSTTLGQIYCYPRIMQHFSKGWTGQGYLCWEWSRRDLGYLRRCFSALTQALLLKPCDVTWVGRGCNFFKQVAGASASLEKGILQNRSIPSQVVLAGSEVGELGVSKTANESRPA